MGFAVVLFVIVVLTAPTVGVAIVVTVGCCALLGAVVGSFWVIIEGAAKK